MRVATEFRLVFNVFSKASRAKVKECPPASIQREQKTSTKALWSISPNVGFPNHWGGETIATGEASVSGPGNITEASMPTSVCVIILNAQRGEMKLQTEGLS